MPIQDQMKPDRLTIRYVQEGKGQPKPEELPFRIMVLGNFSGGTSKDCELDLDERPLKKLNENSNLNKIMEEMKIKLEVVVPNKIDAEEESLRVNIPIDSINSFTPKEIAHNIPQLRSLLLMKNLLLELQSNIANKKEFNQLLSKLFSNQDNFKQLKEKLEGHSMFQIPQQPTLKEETS